MSALTDPDKSIEEKFHEIINNLSPSNTSHQKTVSDQVNANKDDLDTNDVIDHVYDQPSTSAPKQEDIIDEDGFIEEPYIADSRLKLVHGLTLPKTMREASQIETTAAFVSKSGPQMEIVIKVKQNDDKKNFGFLDFHNPLNPFYKMVLKNIKETGYAPTKYTPKKRPTTPPSLLSEKLSETPPLKKPKLSKNDIVLGPISEAEAGKITHEKVHKETFDKLKKEYNIKNGNDMYSKLFKNLSKFAPKVKEKPVVLDKESSDYYEWYLRVYGVKHELDQTPLSEIAEPTQSKKNIVSSAINYILNHGVKEEERLLNANHELSFLKNGDPFYFYYQIQLKKEYERRNTPKEVKVIEMTKLETFKAEKNCTAEQLNTVLQRKITLDVEDVVPVDKEKQAERRRKAKLVMAEILAKKNIKTDK
uniref:SURP motif domain-containing protein n=1 Tax=Rhabditophanes sp. KR3021 TaxID=114890 RepID=A0AC35TY16_9BILA